MANDFLFADEQEATGTVEEGRWKVLIVDDEPEVHAVTKLALNDFTFQGKGLEFLSAYSGAEAKEMIVANPDTAIVLLDVVMETDDAGLNVASFIRQQAGNKFVRIILRTGQPGQAPERTVIVNYDINDYKSKTELTAQKLFTVVMASLRSYRDILMLEQNRVGLEKIITASANLFSMHSMEEFINGIMQQLTSIIGGPERAMYVTTLVAGNDSNKDNKELVVFAGQGEYAQMEGKLVKDVLNDDMRLAFRSALQNREIVYGDDFLIAYCASRSSLGSLLYLSGLPEPINQNDKHLIELFAQNVQIAFDNVLLKSDVEDTQRELVYRLSEAVESRSKETGQHVKRVADLCEFLALEYGLSSLEAERVKLAAPLHDVGKIGIADAILNKQASLNDDEWKEMQRHAELGFDILKNSRRPIIQAGAVIARDHHEKWDGSGYPGGKKAEDIHLYGRIAALADAYDALRNRRCYKEPWPLEKVVELIKSQSGRHFEPKLVEIFSKNVDKMELILQRYPD